MELKYITGDLVKQAEEFDLIAHGCNCFVRMGSGIAPLIKAKFPEAYEVDCKTIVGDKSKLGTISYTENTNPIVVNCYTQYRYDGRQRGEMDLDYDALISAMKLIKEKFTGKRMGFPLIGCGLAGGSWDVVSRILEEELDGEDVTIVLLK